MLNIRFIINRTWEGCRCFFLYTLWNVGKKYFSQIHFYEKVYALKHTKHKNEYKLKLIGFIQNISSKNI